MHCPQIVQRSGKSHLTFGDYLCQQFTFVVADICNFVFEKIHRITVAVKGYNKYIWCSYTISHKGVKFVWLVKDNLAFGQMNNLVFAYGVNLAFINVNKFPERVAFSFKNIVFGEFKVVYGIYFVNSYILL